VGAAAAYALRSPSVKRATALAAMFGGTVGAATWLLGGRLMLGSLELLISGFPNSRLKLDQLSHPFASSGLNQLAHLIDSVAEVGLFAAGVVGAMALARRRSDRNR